LKLELLEALTRVLPAGLGSAILSSSGSDAVESALKTALIVTGLPGVVAFEGAYHGLGLGALDVTQREHFRAPFEARLPNATRFVPYGDADAVR
jgi:4-aminobutyrate aminotransferase/(S)-3-amino-2-methylpropionate transaminase